MPTANGSVISTNGSKFVAIFIIEEIQYIFSGDIAPNTGAFATITATLTYSTLADLAATRSYTGQVGISTVKFNLNNSVTIEGTLGTQVSPASTTSGVGSWTTA